MSAPFACTPPNEAQWEFPTILRRAVPLRLPAQGPANYGPCHAHLLQDRPVGQLVRQVANGERYIAPAKVIADTEEFIVLPVLMAIGDVRFIG